jgi:hypothetical protein
MELTVKENGLLRFARVPEEFGQQVIAGDTPLHRIGYECDTCGDLFSLIAPIETPLAPEEISRRLASPMDMVTTDLLDSLTPLLPAGTYKVGLLNMMPRLREEKRGGDSDEQEIDYWFLGRSLSMESLTPCWESGLEESGDQPATEDTFSELLEETEVVISYRKYQSIDWNRVYEYADRRDRGIPPTAVALSIAEGRHPGGNRFAYQRLTHFLIDGHHKMMAAAKFYKPIQILSFFHQQETRLPLKYLRVRHEQEYCGKRLSFRESARLWYLRQQKEFEQS